jgi:hypothetical protein
VNTLKDLFKGVGTLLLQLFVIFLVIDLVGSVTNIKLTGFFFRPWSSFKNRGTTPPGGSGTPASQTT